MILATLKTLFYVPLYNGLIFLISLLPGASVGVAVILFTCVVKTALFPLSYRATKFQFEMKTHEAELNGIKERFKKDKQAQGKATLDFYREKGINPFAGILPLFIQIPIVIALYYVFFQGGLPNIDLPLLYSFIPTPQPDMIFFGIDIGGKSIILAFLAGITQYLQSHFAMPAPAKRSATPSFQEDLARGMHFQMKYFLPVFIGFVAYQVSGAIALYFITSNLFTVGQEFYIRRTFRDKHIVETTENKNAKRKM